MKKLSMRHLILKKISNRSDPDIEKLIIEMKEQAKQDPAIIRKFKEYNVPIDNIDDISVQFCDLDVSAKTKNREIFLNEKMLDNDSDVKDPTHYLIHELVHYLQQSTGQNCNHNKNEDYLDLDTEEEAFKTQINFKKREESEEEADDYVEKLLDHHDLTGAERNKKKKELMEE